MAAAAGALAVAVSAAATHYGLPVGQLATQALRVTAAQVLAVVYRGDLQAIELHTTGYVHGELLPARQGAAQAWAAAVEAVPGLKVTVPPTSEIPKSVPPFVYESPDAQHLVAFRERYGLEKLLEETTSEYDAILRIGGWVGRQFDHGTDPTVGGDKGCDPIGLVESGRAGARYWCEIAARLMVHTATALGFPARIVTASRDGYTWEHAVAEIWSNEFRKWIVVDTDFNEVYERRGIPLSATELMRHGLDWQRAGELTVREIAPEKPNVSRGGNPVALYRYVHVDLRTDWCTRPLRRGSPAGGDRATWWAATDDFGPLLTAKQQIEEPAEMNWPVNGVRIGPRGAPRRDGEYIVLSVGLQTYSPYFKAFEWSVDGVEWHVTAAATFDVALPAGTTELRARVRTRSPFPGPVSSVRFTVEPA